MPNNQRIRMHIIENGSITLPSYRHGQMRLRTGIAEINGRQFQRFQVMGTRWEEIAPPPPHNCRGGKGEGGGDLGVWGSGPPPVFPFKFHFFLFLQTHCSATV